jgi:uncharacterized protein YegP (UPF0339 family)
MTETRKTKQGIKALIALLAICIILLLFSTTVSAATLGDVNGDGAINILDVVLVNNYVLGGSTLTATQSYLADVNRDGTVDIFDLVLIMQMASGMIYEFPVLPAPTLSSPANNTLISTDYVTFQWGSVSGAIRYQLEVVRVSDGTLFKDPVLATTGTTLLGFPNDGTQFRWRVRAGNNDGWGSWSAYRNFANGTAPADTTAPPPAAPAPAPSAPVVPTVTVPSAPTLLSPGDNATVAGASINFQWNPSTGANKYELRVIKVSDGSTFKLQPVGNLTYNTQIGFPNDGSVYRWQVRAGNDGGWSSWSSERTFTNSGELGIPILTSPAANANVFGSAILFRWNAASGATRYEIQVLNENGTVFRSETLNTATTTTFYGFPNDGRKFTWRVRAGNVSGMSANWSEQRTFYNGYLPAAPNMKSPENNHMPDGTSISFSWDASAGADKYNLQVVRARDGLVFKDVILGNVTTLSLTGFPNDGTAYMWRVRAGSKDGWGPWPSAYYNFTSGNLQAPILVSPANNANVASSRVTFEWRPVSGATRYKLVIENSSGETYREIVLGNIYASIQRELPNKGDVFTWYVVAGNSYGWAESSAKRTFVNGTPVATPVQQTPVADTMVVLNALPDSTVYDLVDFGWEAVADATIYQLEVTRVRDGQKKLYDITSFNNDPVINKPLSVFVNTDTFGAEQYRWRLRAGIGTSPGYTWSNWSPYRDFVAYNELPLRPAPILISPAVNATAASETVTFKWTEVSGASSYNLQVVNVSGGTMYKSVGGIPAAADPEFAQPGFPNKGDQFMWRVRANNGAWSLYRYFANGSWWLF